MGKPAVFKQNQKLAFDATTAPEAHEQLHAKLNNARNEMKLKSLLARTGKLTRARILSSGGQGGGS